MAADKSALVEILLVEDNDDDASWTVDALAAENVRCNVTRAEDGEEALTILNKQGKHAGKPSPALMLLDLSLPRKGGLDVLREMRASANPDLKNLPVVILTASTAFGDAKEALNLRVASYMSKPVKLQELVVAVKQLLPDPQLSDRQRDVLQSWADEMGRFA